MVRCSRSNEDIYMYFYNELSIEEKADFEKHLGTCESCQKELANFKQTASLIDQNKVPEMHAQFWEGYDEELQEKLNHTTVEGDQKFAVQESGFHLAHLWEWFNKNFAYTFIAGVTIVLMFLLFPFMLNQNEIVRDNKENQIKISHINTMISKDVEYEEIDVVYHDDQKVTDNFVDEKSITSMARTDIKQDVTQEGVRSGLYDEAFEDELMLEEMLLLAELGVDINFEGSDEDLKYEMELLNESSTS